MRNVFQCSIKRFDSAIHTLIDLYWPSDGNEKTRKMVSNRINCATWFSKSWKHSKKNWKNEKSDTETWIRVIMKESTEVNGVRFPEGIQIDVTEDDSKKLIGSGKAAIIS